MELKQLYGKPNGAVLRDGEEPLTLGDGSVSRTFEDGFDSESPAVYEEVTRPSGRTEWFMLVDEDSE